MAREISISKGQITIVDDEWYPILSQYKWHCVGKPGGTKPVYAARRISIEGYEHGRVVLMHYFILPRIPGLSIDHINGNGLDNRRENLRYASIAENNCNTKRRRDGQSKYKGVTRGKVPGTWRANIYLDGRQTSLGVFNTEEEAAAAYNEAAIVAHGEFARLNDVEEIEYVLRPRAHGGKPPGRSGIAGIRINYVKRTDKWQVFLGKKYVKQFATLQEAKAHATSLAAEGAISNLSKVRGEPRNV